MVGLDGTPGTVRRERERDLAPPRDGVLDVEAAWLAARPRAWDRLSREALAPTPFYSRHVVEAHIGHAIMHAPRILTVWRDGALAAAWPHHAIRLGWGRRARAAWTSPFITSSAPLVARRHLDETVRSLVDGLLTASTPWLLPRFPGSDELGSAILREIASRRGRSAVLDPFERPVLDRRRSFELCASGRPSGRRKDLRRRLRRLAETGHLSFRSDTAGAGLTDAIETFLALEAAGWKGRRGTALASHPRTAGFARALFADVGGPVASRADLLLRDGQPIAVSLALISGGTAYLLKTAYDEALARFTPGILLEEAIIRAVHDTKFADRLDSAAEPGTPLDDLYPDRLAIGDVLLGRPDQSARSFERLVRAERSRRRLKAWLKRKVETLRRD